MHIKTHNAQYDKKFCLMPYPVTIA